MFGIDPRFIQAMQGGYQVPSYGKPFEFSEKEIRAKAEEMIPGYMVEGLLAYVMDGVAPGDFLLSVLNNDFAWAVTKADTANSQHLREWAILIHNYTPGGCHGSAEDVKEWIEIKGLNGLVKRMRTLADDASDEFERRDAEDAKSVKGAE